MKHLKESKFRSIIAHNYPQISVSKKDDCLLLEGTVESLDQINEIGYLAARVHSGGVINKIALKDYQEPAMKISPIKDSLYEGLRPEVLVIGGGVVGCAILRELSKYHVDAVLLEKENDVALHASSHNDGCIHVGADLSRHSKKYHYLRRAVPVYETLAKDLGFDYVKTGQTVVFENKAERLLGPLLRIMFARKGNPDMQIWSAKKVKAVAPGITDSAKFALHFPRGAVVSPYHVTIAFAENAIENGAKVLLETAVLGMTVKDHVIERVQTNRGTIYPKIVINAAGVFSDKVADMAEDQFFTIHPREGLDVIFDKKIQKRLTNTTISLYESKKSRGKAHTKGGGLVPTTDGNLLAGPTARETIYRENFETDRDSFDSVLEKHRRTLPGVTYGDVITYFSGIRAATYEEDFVIQPGKWTRNIVHAAGIQSPGLTAAPAIAEDVVHMVSTLLEKPLVRKTDFRSVREVAKPLCDMSFEERDARIKANPDYGHIICRCEEISRGEIIDALHRPLPVLTVDGIKRRVRPGMGRCQGGFCQPLVLQIMASEMKLDLESIAKKGTGKILLGNSKGEAHGNV